MVDLNDVPEVPKVDAKEAADLVLTKKKAYLDVRGVDEYERGHVPGSVNVPYLTFKEDFSRELNPRFVEEACAALPDKDAEIVVSCQLGRRGAFATKALQDAGFKSVVNLRGGLAEWTDAGLPTQK